jgi:hypothetical protein
MSRVGVSELNLYEILLVPGDLNRLEFCLSGGARLNSSRAAESEGVKMPGRSADTSTFGIPFERSVSLECIVSGEADLV